MKLNGQDYLTKYTVKRRLDDIILILKQDGWKQIDSSFKNYVNSTHASKVATQILKFYEKFNELFQNQKFVSYNEVIEIANENKHDPKKESVKLFSQGAYGTIILADVNSVERYVFNKCIDYFIENVLIKIK
tara:strand:- start:31839 stop:32234 length:396 start_codon:yes stop_codon:yes gene_type:complete